MLIFMAPGMTLLDYGVQKASHRSFQRVYISQVR
jgi:hypothetical protein